MALKEVLKQKIEEFRPHIQHLIKEHGKVVIDQVTIDQAIGGARDVPGYHASDHSLREHESRSRQRLLCRRAYR